METNITINTGIRVIDSLMGTGKTSYILDIINSDPVGSYICVVPTIKECERYAEGIEKKVFYKPLKMPTKSKGLHHLIAKGENIITTHSLIQKVDKETIGLLEHGNYTLVVDEALDCIHPYKSNFKDSDRRTMFDDGYVYIGNDGFLVWNNDKAKDYDGRYNDIMNLCNLRSLMCMRKMDGTWSHNILMWNLPANFFSLFRKAYICTYLWEGSIQKSYFDLFNIKYKHFMLDNGELVIYDNTRESKLRNEKWNLINLYQGGLDDIGVPDGENRHPLTLSWYQRKANHNMAALGQVKNNTYNYFRNITKTKSKDNMFTTFLDYKKYVKGNGYAKSFVPCNAKGTNEYREKYSLAYLVNKYPDTRLVQFFKSYGVDVDKDLYALSEMLHWIWRSRIRDGQDINLYLPSMRMRELLGKWLTGEL